MYAVTSVCGHAVLVEPPVRAGMGKEIPNGRKLVGETAFRNLPVNRNDPNSGCGTAASTGNPGPGTPKVTWTAGEEAKICWETTIAHPEQQGIKSPGIRASIAYTANERFDVNILFKDVDGGNTGTTYCKTVRLRADKSCDSCVLQWAWVSIPDGGAYLGCADIRVLPATNIEGCKTSLWLGTVNNCAQGNGLYDFGPMLNGHPGGAPAIQRVCQTGTTAGNWIGKSGSHGQYTGSVTAKNDITYAGKTIARLGPARNCPQNAQTPPNLPPGPVTVVTQAPPPGQPNPPPGQPNPPPGQPNPPPGGCAAGTVLGTGIPYPVSVLTPMANGQTITVPCSQAHRGYTSDKATHTGFTVTCNAGRLVVPGGRCAAYPSCSSAQANAATMCGTLQFDTNSLDTPCVSGSCTAADCCVGGTLDLCDPTTLVSLISYQTANAQCANIAGRGDIIPDDKCRKFSGGGTIDSYYQLTCRRSGIRGSFACTDSTCTNCATNSFSIASADRNSCTTNSFLCTPGQPSTCQQSDFRFTAVITDQRAVAGATTWAMSMIGGVVGVIMANI